jgi:hypothetical protein
MKDQIIQWAKDRKIIPNSNTRTQCMKGVSELGELADALIKHDAEAVCDAIGDIMVCYYIARELRSHHDCFDALDVLESIVLLFVELHTSRLEEGDIPQMLGTLAESQGLTLQGCIEHAYNIIKDRRGELLPNGVFVKEVEVF